MVTKSEIKYVIDKSISVKCGQRLTLNKGILKTFEGFKKSMNGKSFEKAILVNDNGEIISSKEGGVHSVPMDEGDLDKWLDLNNGKPLHLTHNHPMSYGFWEPNCLSPADIRTLFRKSSKEDYVFKSMSMEDCFTGMRMTLVRGDNFKDEDFQRIKDIDFDLMDSLRHGWDYDIHKIQQDTFNRLWSKRSKGLTPDSPEFIKVLKECNIKATEKAMSSDGYYDRLRKIQEEFRKVNCRLSISWSPENCWYDGDEERKAFYY